MSATVEIGISKAVIEGYEWSSENEALLGALNSLLDPAGPSGADPNADLHAAQEAVKIFGGKLLDYDEAEYVEGRIY